MEFGLFHTEFSDSAEEAYARIKLNVTPSWAANSDKIKKLNFVLEN